MVEPDRGQPLLRHGGEVGAGTLDVEDVDRIPEAMRAKVMGKWGD